MELTNAQRNTIQDCIDWLLIADEERDDVPEHNQTIWVSVKDKSLHAEYMGEYTSEMVLPDLFSCTTACCLAGYVGVLEYTKKNKDPEIFEILESSTRTTKLEDFAAEKLGLLDEYGSMIPGSTIIFEDYQTRENLIEMLEIALKRNTWDDFEFDEYDADCVGYYEEY